MNMKVFWENSKFDIFLICTLLLTFFSYTGLITRFYFPIIIVIALVLIILNKGILAIIALALFSQMSFSGMRDNANVTTLYAFGLTGILVLDAIKNRSISKLGVLSIPLLILSFLSILTGLNGISFYATFVGFFNIFSIFLVYAYLVNILEKSPNTYKNLSKMFMYMGMLVTFEMMYFVYQSELLVIDVIQQRSIDLGWENINIIIYANIVSIPFIGYLITQSKYKLHYMLFALINVLGILMTLSRSSILTVGVFIVFLVPIMIYQETQKTSLLIQGLVFLAIASIGFYILEQYDIISDYITTLVDRDLTRYDDRLALLKVAWEHFKEHPIIGSGGIFSSRYHLAHTGSINYHNTIAQTSTLGILGLLAFGYLFFVKTRLVIRMKDPFKYYFLIMLYVTTFVNGSLQPMYYYVTYLFYIFIILASIEVNEN